LERLCSRPLLVALGEISYSMYLVHIYVLRIVNRPPRPLGWLSAIDGAMCLTLGIALTLLLSSATYRLIEMPGRVWLRRHLHHVIVRGFGDRSGRPPTVFVPPRQLLAKRVPLIAVATLGFAAVIVTGTALQSEAVGDVIHRFVTGHRSEITIVSASYGLSCKAAAVNTPAEGNVTDFIAEICRRSAKCEFEVSIPPSGDPANGCAKDFTVVYGCTGQEGSWTTYIPGEAYGKTVLLQCPVSGSTTAAGPVPVGSH
jgi:hypothetical protein